MEKTLILVAAPPACGKTYCAKKLAAGLSGAAYFDKDDLAPMVAQIFAAAGQEADMDGGFYAAAIRDAEYETVLQLALSALEFSDCAIINAPFGWQLAHPDYFEKLKRALSEKRIRLVFVWVQADEQTCRKRMEERAAERDRKKIRDWESYRRSLRFAPPAFLAEEKLVDCFFVIDNRDEPSCEASVAAILKEI